METSYNDTQAIIERILAAPTRNATKILNNELQRKQQTLPQFYEGVIKHAASAYQSSGHSP